MRIALALSAFIILSGIAFSAHAKDCETTVYGGVYTAYAFQDLGILLEDRPVAQGGATRTCGKLSYDIFTSTTLSTEGPYGNRGGGDEIDLTVTWSDSFESPIGPLEVELSAAYWLVADFRRSEDDQVAFSAKVGRPYESGPVTVTPYVMLSEWIELSGAYRTTVLRAGASASFALSSDWSLDSDVSHVSESFDGLSTWRADLGLTRSFSNGWSVTGEVLAAERMQTVFGLSIERTF